MFKPVIAIAAALGAVSLSGCEPFNINPVVTDVTAVAQQVIADCEQVCGVLPDIYDVEALVPIYGGDAIAIEQAICAQVAAANGGVSAKKLKRVRHNLRPVVVHGIIVHFE
jgi:hypothetical protein